MKIIAFGLSALMVLSLAACGNSIENGEVPVSSSSMAASESSVSSAPQETVSSTAESDIATEFSASTSAEPETPPETPSMESETTGSNTLVVFFSRHRNNLEGVDAVASASLSSNDATILADMIVESTGADLHQIITVDPYPTDYDESTEVAIAERDANARPALASSVENMEQYDVVYLGYPNWWGTIPMPVATFLESYDFSGKTIIPFCTHEGSGLGSSESMIAQLVPDAILLEGFAVRGNSAASSQADLEQWLQGLGITG